LCLVFKVISGEIALEINKTMPGLNLFPPALKRCSAAALRMGCPAPIKFFSSRPWNNYSQSYRFLTSYCFSRKKTFTFNI